ncbi:hypothetical protein ACQKP8_26975 [Photobacterium alginatilyticum]|uniref:hypothetical protein n=1 Tax=Photobacterium alginatilyticum TaxID=1775171 RepID=UPI004067C64A
MPNTNEQRLDVIDNCNILLLKFEPFSSGNNTPEERMVAQLTWLKQRAEKNQLELPVKPEMLSILRYIYTDGTLNCYASKQNNRECIYEEIENHMEKLLILARHGKLLLKKEYFNYIPPCIEVLLHLLENPERELLQHEVKLIDELVEIKESLLRHEKRLPFRSYMPDYKGFIKSDSSLIDMKSTVHLFKIIDNLVFNGTRPDSWLTPEHAEHEVKKYLSLIK